MVLTIQSWADQARRIDEVVVGDMRFQPAVFRLDTSVLANRISTPKRAGDYSINVLCHALLDESGSTKNIYCYSEEGHNEDAKFARTVSNGLSGTKYYPARVNGSRQAATVPLSVRFTQRGKNRATDIFLNHGQYRLFFGDDYMAVQNYYFGRPSSFGRSCGNFTDLKVQLHVGSDGSTYEVAFVGGTASANCLQQLHEQLGAMRSIPLIVDGRAIASRIQVPFFTNIAVRD